MIAERHSFTGRGQIWASGKSWHRLIITSVNLIICFMDLVKDMVDSMCYMLKKSCKPIVLFVNMWFDQWSVLLMLHRPNYRLQDNAETWSISVSISIKVLHICCVSWPVYWFQHACMTHTAYRALLCNWFANLSYKVEMLVRYENPEKSVFIQKAFINIHFLLWKYSNTRWVLQVIVN